MKTAIIYESKHHGNTRKVCQALADEGGAELFEVTGIPNPFPWDEYDMIGFASGIAYNRFYEGVNNMASQVPAGKKVFFIYTCANNSKDFAREIKEITEKHGAITMGTYGCKGYNTYGPLRLIGGMNKQNPTVDEIRAAVDFLSELEDNYGKK